MLNQRSNNFDFLRLLAAFLVLVSHQYALTGRYGVEIYHRTSIGEFGVLLFFSISGFLVSQSWRKDPNILRFVAKRFLRIWPGLAIVTLLSSLILGPLVSSLHWQEYFARPEFWQYLENLRLSIKYALPGVFENNPHPVAVNGSLWTIPIEVRCYLILLLFGCVGITRKPLLVLATTILCGVYYFVFRTGSTSWTQHFALFFFSGVCLDLFRDKWQSNPAYLLTVASIVAVACHLLGFKQLATLAFIPIFAIYIGTRTTPILKSFGRFGDISFGVYIYSFPVQQTFVWALGKDYPFAQGLLISSAITIALAWLSCHLVEQPALNLKRHLRTDRASTGVLSANPRTSI